MLSRLIHLSLKHRAIVLVLAIALFVVGVQTTRNLPVEVLPDMTKPTVTILTECPGLAPEEVEVLVTRPIESSVQGVGGLDRLRSNSDVSLSLVFAEFAWGTDIYRARQLVQERLQAAAGNLPAGVRPGLTPVSSLMGEVLLVGLRSDAMHPRDLRTIADTVIARRLQSIPGVAEVLAIGGGVTQIHVLPDPIKLHAFGLSVAELETAVEKAAGNTTGGYLTTSSQEIMVRNLGMTTDLAELGGTVLRTIDGRPVTISDVARVEFGVQPMRGDASVNGQPGVILSIDKSPGFDTLKLTAEIEAALAGLQPSLPAGVKVDLLFRQGDFISHAIGNLKEAIRDGAIMVTIVLFLFLLNFRTTLITLTAMPLSFISAMLVFKWFDVSVNSMTLGGLAVAIGMVVDDAIVDVENVFRRLRENAALPVPRPKLEVIAAASGEVRNSILYATVLIILVFLPLLSLEGLEGRLFTPIAIATIVSMAASFFVSLTVIPVLCSLLLGSRDKAIRPAADAAAPLHLHAHKESAISRGMKAFVEHTFLRAAFSTPMLILGLTGILLLGALMLYPMMGREFLPVFNEGSATISLGGPAGASLQHSNEVGEVAVRILQGIPEVKSVGRRAGRAERDDHVMPVSVNEFDVEFHEGGRPRAVVFKDIRDQLGTIPGTFVNVGQPIGHRLSHMLSGVSAKIAVKVFGPDLDMLRAKGTEIEKLAKAIPGMTDVYIEKQVPIPQLRIEIDRERAQAYGLQPGGVNEQLALLIGGSVLAELREGQRTVDLLLRLPPEWRDSPERLQELQIETPEGPRVPLGRIARIVESKGPNVINRENTQRRIVVSANTAGRDLESVVTDLQNQVREKVHLPQGYYVSFEGEFKAQQAAARRIGISSALVFCVIAVLLYGYFRSVSLAAQVMLNIPLALMGGLALTWLLVGNISIATLVGFIAVAGVAARNGIMMLSHYLHLMKHEGEGFTRAMITRGTLERLVPVLMTALSAGIALVPLLLSAHEPGKEILHPVAVVIVGGLVSSTLLDLAVTPAVFWLFGRKAAERALAANAPAAQ